MSILDTPSGRIQSNWTVARDKDARAPAGYSFAVVAPYNDGLPGQASLGFFAYRPHAELAARAPAIADAAENLLIAIGMGWDLDGCVEAVKTALDL